MIQNKKRVPARRLILLLLILGDVIILREAYTGHANWYWSLLFTLPVLLLAIIKVRREKLKTI